MAYRLCERKYLLKFLAVAVVLLALAGAHPAAAKSNSFFGKLEWKTEKHFGRATVEELRSAYGFVEDPILTAYINRLGNSLSSVSDRTDIPYEYYVVDTDEVNAFAAPGGFIFVTRGLLEETDTEDELSGVIGHEVGHVAAKHGAKQIKQLPFIIVGMSVLASKTSERTSRIAGAALSLVQLHYSRENEYEADRLGAKYSFRAGYDPAGMVSFFEKLRKESPDDGLSRLDVAISSHPKTTGRIAKVEALPETAETAQNKVYLGAAYASRYDYRGAREAYGEALRLEPDNSEARDGLRFVELALAGERTPRAIPADAPASVADAQLAEASLEDALEHMQHAAPLAEGDFKGLSKRLDAMREGFYKDISAYRAIAEKVPETDTGRQSLLDGAATYFGYFAGALDYYRETGRRIIEESNEIKRAARVSLYRIGRGRTLPQETIRAANDIESIVRQADFESYGLFQKLSDAVDRTERTYNTTRNAMRDIGASIGAQYEPIDSFTGRLIADRLSDQTESLHETAKDTLDVKRKLALRRAGIRRATLDLDASLLSPNEERIYGKMLERRFKIDPAEVAALRAKGLGYGGALLTINRARAAGKKSEDLAAGFDPKKVSLEDHLATRTSEAGSEAARARDDDAGAVFLRLAAADLRTLTGRRPLVAMSLPQDEPQGLFDRAALEASDPKLAEALRLYEDGKYEEARRALDERGRSLPATALSHLALGLVLRATGDNDAALTEFKFASKKDGKNPSIRLLIGNTFAGMGRYEDAQAEYETAIRMAPGRAAAYAANAYSLAMRGDTAAAESNFRKAAELGSRDPSVFINYGLLCYGEGRIEDAIAQFRASLAIEPEQPLVAEMIERLES